MSASVMLGSLFFLGFVASTCGSSWPASLPICSKECPLANRKFEYEKGSTYTYSYEGYSEIIMKDVAGGVSKMEWTAEVDLSWLTSCDMAIIFKNVSFDRVYGPPGAEVLTRHPLVVAIIDGHVRQVCSHPDDDTWSINLKKGVASAVQNTLPSTTLASHGLNITESDINGKCQTSYSVEQLDNHVLIEKRKNLRYCQDRFVTQSEIPNLWHKTPLPMAESLAICKQDICGGIYSSITCEDTHVIKPSYGAYKYIEAKQVFELHFKSKNREISHAISNIQGQLLHGSLRFTYETPKKDPNKMIELEEIWKEVCENSKQNIGKEIADLVSEAIVLMRLVPEETVEHIFQKIKNGDICKEQHKIENLFLDAIAFIGEASTVKLMVDEILSGDIYGGRSAFYTLALYLTPRPTLRAIEALKPLFENSERYPIVTLAAATMVNTYCQHHINCYEDAPIRQASVILSSKVLQQCTPSMDEHTMENIVLLLKAIGNMGVVPTEVARSIITCMETEGIDDYVQFVAAQAFRNAKCQRELTKQLVMIATDPIRKTEVRIASYLSVIKCIADDDVQEIISKISKEINTQVRGFILSHLLNLQDSIEPQKEGLRNLLSSFSIPANFSSDIRKYSHNYDWSYYAPALGLGAGVESNIVYAPGSFIPHSITFNLSSVFGTTPINLGELGIRAAGLDDTLKKLLGPNGYLKTSSVNSILNDLLSFFKGREYSILDQLTNIMKGSSIDSSIVAHFLNKIYGDNQMESPRIDFFLRLNGQEITYASLSGNPLNISIRKEIESFVNTIREALVAITDTEIDNSRTFRMDFDYSVPTTQGIPIKMQLDGTVVLGLTMESQLSSMDSNINLHTCLAVQVNGFLGFDSFLSKCGVQTKNSFGGDIEFSTEIKRGNKYEIQIDIPHKLELIDLKSETYLMEAIRGLNETKIFPDGVRDVRIQKKKCLDTIEEMTGLKLCYDVDLPNIFLSEGLPLGLPSVAKVIVEKSDPGMRGYKIIIDTVKDKVIKHFRVKAEAYGSTTPRKSEAMMSYYNQGNVIKMTAAISAESAGGIKLAIMTRLTDFTQQVELRAYASSHMHFSPENEIFEVFLSSRNSGMDSHIHAFSQTKNTLKYYIDYLCEVEGDIRTFETTGLPYPKRLEKFNFRTIIGNYNLLAFIQRGNESQYDSAWKVGSKQYDWLVLETTHNIRSSWEDGISCDNVALAKLGQAEYKSTFTVLYSGENTGTSLQIVRSEENRVIINLAAYTGWQNRSYESRFWLDLPWLMKELNFDSQLQEQGSGQYHLQAVIKQESSIIFTAEGPVIARLSPDMRQIQAVLSVSDIITAPMSISGMLIMAKNRQFLSTEVKEHQETIFASEWHMSVENEHETSTSFRIFLPNITDNLANAVITPRHIELSFNNLVYMASDTRRIKGYTYFDFGSKKVIADIFLDADRDKKQRISAEVTVLGSTSDTNGTIIHGGWNYEGNNYQYKTEIRRSDPTTWVFGRNFIKGELSTPSEKTYSAETILNIEQQSSGVKMHAEFKYRNPENQEHKLKCGSSLVTSGRHSGALNINTRMELISPMDQHSFLGFVINNEVYSSKRNAYLHIIFLNPSISRPIGTTLYLIHRENSYKVDWIIDIRSPAKGAQWELLLTPEHAIQRFKVALNLREIINLLKVCHGLVINDYDSQSQNHYDRSHYLPERRNSAQRVYRRPWYSELSGQYQRSSENIHSNEESKESAHKVIMNEQQNTHYAERLQNSELIEQSLRHESIMEYFNRNSQQGQNYELRNNRQISSQSNRDQGDSRSSEIYQRRNAENIYAGELNNHNIHMWDVNAYASDEAMIEHKHHNQTQDEGFSEYLILYEKSNHTSHKMHIKTPSRSAEGEVYVSPSECVVKFYPTNHISDESYGFSFTQTLASNQQEENKYVGRFNNLALEREKGFELMYSRKDEVIRGCLILDIFDRPEDIISAVLESTRTTKESAMIKAVFTGNALKLHPKVWLNVAYTSQTAGLDIEFSTDNNSYPALLMSAKYDMSSPRSGVMAFALTNDKGLILDISAAMEPVYEGDCFGVKISALYRIALIEGYDILAKFCKPGYLEIIIKQHGAQKTYVFRAGLKENKNAELSLSQKDERSQEYKYIALIRVRLMSPTVVNFDAAYEAREVYILWNTISRKWFEISVASGKWINRICKIILKEGVNNVPYDEKTRLWREVIEEAKKIYHDFVSETLIRGIKAMEHIMRSQQMRGIVGGYKMFWSRLQELHKSCQNFLHRFVIFTKNSLPQVYEIAEAVMDGCAQWMKNGELPDETRRFVEAIQESFIWKDFQRWVDEVWIDSWEMEVFLMQIMARIKDTLLTDVNRIRLQLMDSPEVRETVSWIIQRPQFDQLLVSIFEDIIDKAIMEAMLTPVRIREDRVEVHIPLQQPVNSLTQALRYVASNPIQVPDNILRLYESLTFRSPDNWLWWYYNVLPKGASLLLPPENRTAVLVDGSEILTFDGAVLRVPHSSCRVILMVYESNALVIEHPESTFSPQLILITQWTTIVIKPDFRVIIDGAEMNADRKEVENVQIWNLEDVIKITTSFMILRAYPANNVITVEMNGWTFGKVAGLMGTFDGEKANDWYTPEGTKAPTLHELVRSWQEDQSCQTPSIEPTDAAHTPFLRTLQCQTLLGIRSRCSPIVRLDPFVEMCYASSNACDVAMAYHHLCFSKGVDHLFPLVC